MKILILIVLFFRIKQIYTISSKELFKDVHLYSNEICSYNGIPKITTTNEIRCECKERYANEPIKNKIKYINNIMVQCSYERKSRFFTIFLSLCFPIGIDFLYLDQYIAFFISLFMSLITIVICSILFYLNYRINLKSKESKMQIRLNKLTNRLNSQENERDDNYSYRVLVLFCKIFTFAHLIFIITVLILHSLGIIPDGKGVSTENDLGYLFTTPE